MRLLAYAVIVTILLAGCGGGDGESIPEGIDLTATSIEPPVNCDWDVTIDIDVTLRNRGKTESLNTWTVEIYLSDDTTIGGTDTLLDSYPVAGLAAQTDLPRMDSVTIPVSGTDGIYYIGYIVDSGDDEAEEIETNNTEYTQIYIGAATMPDLIASNLIVPDPPKAMTGKSFLLKVDVTNEAVPYLGPVKVFFYISNSSGIDPATDTRIATALVSNLPYGTPRQVSLLVAISDPGGFTTSEYYVGAYVDPEFQIAEEFENNNTQDAIMYVGRTYSGSDAYEPDNIGQYATPTDIGGTPQFHTFRPGTEEDWMSVTTTGPATLLIEAYNPSSCDPDVYVYTDPNGINLIAIGFEYGAEAVLVTLSSATTIYIMVNDWLQQPNGDYLFRVTYQ